MASNATYVQTLEELAANELFETAYPALEAGDRDVVRRFAEAVWEWFEQNGHEGCQPGSEPTDAELAYLEGVDAAIETTRRAYREAGPAVRTALEKLGKKLQEIHDEGRP